MSQLNNNDDKKKKKRRINAATDPYYVINGSASRRLCVKVEMYCILFPALGFHTCRINQPPAPRPIRLCGSPLHKADTKAGFTAWMSFMTLRHLLQGRNTSCSHWLKTRKTFPNHREFFFLRATQQQSSCVTKVLSD